VVEEYCWAITQAAERSCCDPSDSASWSLALDYTPLHVRLYLTLCLVRFYLGQNSGEPGGDPFDGTFRGERDSTGCPKKIVPFFIFYF
jgi:hypothetical protein